MSPVTPITDEFIADGKVELLTKEALMLLIGESFDVAQITENVRFAKDTTNPRDGRAGIAIEASARQGVRHTTEWIVTTNIVFEIRASLDPTGEKIDSLLAIVRDVLSADDIVTLLNEPARGIVFHMDNPQEMNSFDDSDEEEKIRRKVIQMDWAIYVGYETQ